MKVNGEDTIYYNHKLQAKFRWQTKLSHFDELVIHFLLYGMVVWGGIYYTLSDWITEKVHKRFGVKETICSMLSQMYFKYMTKVKNMDATDPFKIVKSWPQKV